MCDHKLEGELLRIFMVLLEFTINVYFNLYFKIKVHHHLKYGQQHVINSLIKLKVQSDEVKNIIMDVVVRGSYHAHAENILLAQLCSDSKEEREFALEKILLLRNGSDIGDMSVRTHKTPAINLDATCVKELIDWKEKIYEPVFTCNMSIDALQSLRDEALQIPPFSVHTQSCERAVQEVSKAICAVYGEKRRDGFIRARVDHREVLPLFISKKDIVKMIEY